ncbi:MAG: LysM peptidoglycan-binding domain-containing protein, partial [Proteobacteria bacterium]|nr:LysM peptidoglycan-binding domain-containing protein [Pseudomonadota bacterium]
MSIRRALLALVLLAAVGGVAVLVFGYIAWLFPKPDTYVVVKGDTLYQIAMDHAVTVDELREWNEIKGDLIEVDQILLVWRGSIETSKPAVEVTPASPVVTSRKKPAGRADLVMPQEKPCLAGPSMDDLDQDEGWLGSEGLSHNQIASSMGAFVHQVLPCISTGSADPVAELELEFTVACTGRVKQIVVVESGDWSPEVSDCVTETLKYTPFPAHDLPSG